MSTIKNKNYSRIALIPNDSLESAMNSAIKYDTGFNKNNICDVDKNSYAKGVCTILDSLSDAYNMDQNLVSESQKLVGMIFSIPGSKDTLEHFLNRISSDLGCKKFSYTQKTIIDDIKNVSNYLKDFFPENNNFDFNSFMVGVKCVIGPIKTTYDKMTGNNLKNSNNIFGKMAGFVVGSFSQFGMNLMKLDERAKPIIEKLSHDINELYYNHSC